MIRALLLSSVLALHVHAAPFPLMLPKAIAPKPTNTYSITISWDAIANASVTNVFVYWVNQQGVIASTNVPAPLTNAVVSKLSPTNQYWIAAKSQANGLTSEPSNIILWRPKVNTFFIIATVPAGPSFCLTNPAGVQFLRIRSTGTNGTVESAPGPRGPWSSFRGSFSVTAGLRYRLTSSLTNDLARIVECERKE